MPTTRKAAVAAELGVRLRRHRRALGLHQADVARQCGVTQQTFSAWENGRRLPGDQGQIAAVACFLGQPVQEIQALIGRVRQPLMDEELVLDELLMTREALALLILRVDTLAHLVEERIATRG